MEVHVVRSPAFMGYLSIPWASSVIEQDDCNLAGYLRFEFCDPCMALSQALARTWSSPVPLVPALLHSFSSSVQGLGHLLTVEAVVWEGLQGRCLPKAWGRHLAEPSRVAPGPRSGWLAQICPQQA